MGGTRNWSWRADAWQAAMMPRRAEVVVVLGASRCDAVLVDCAEREEAAVDALPLERATRFRDNEA